MDSAERVDLRSPTDPAREQIDQVVGALGEQQARLADIHQRLHTLRCTAESADGLVEVTVDASGVLTDVRFGADARRISLEQLGTAVAAAGREASKRAQARTWELMASFTPTPGQLPSPAAVVPGAPSFG
ncbi:YbaB/EbfC family nucleoid-associated protein [Nocardia otitidiscaviarum]|uniref:YbaB/EbfC family nucleoid-associated protein n=1 Tax=Nocardia otitidiscaviarum TaxID=1823 RepID=UPI001895C316|nr:YbaB/EbfC family nucleoid-associated protein [Nocardia otitidiscaviarum]MBF6177620.1 YbaB/EbfC family nucleoid-associated protein [Nocardia otitidiscaviarum]